MELVRIVIADDHPLVRTGLSTILAGVPEFDVVGLAANGRAAIELAATLRPDVVVMDLQMPDVSGVAATREILAANPETRILVVTLFADEDSVFLALRAGARGYVLKDVDETELIEAVRAVARGSGIFSPAVASRVIGSFSSPRPTRTDIAFPNLTEREREILDLLASGRSNGQIARQLDLSPKTVANYASTIFAKLQVADRAEAIIRAREAGMGQRGS
jgi:DNA-binding NarL/FixJ family response regulator